MMRKTITIPNAMEEWIKAQIAEGSYGNDSEYVRDLIRRDQERKSSVKQLQALIDEGLSSGISPHSVSDIMQRVESRMKKDGSLPAHE
ncbi:MAG: type II toxin-antitoxin system ParD family antitoxin [Roseobacter sp.]